MRCLAPKAFSSLLLTAIVLPILGAGLLSSRDAAAQGLEQVTARYTKYEYRIPNAQRQEAPHRRLTRPRTSRSGIRSS